jgi:homoserine O-succinyltransferase
MAWSNDHVYSTLHICWGAQAGLHFHYGIPKYTLPHKLSGIYDHRVLKPSSPLFRGFDDFFSAPHSRYTEVREDDVLKIAELELLSTSDEAGVFAVKSQDSRRFFIMGHPEYDPDTLAKEYFRDTDKGLDISVPAHYFPHDNPSQPPVVTWRSAGQLLYTNWLNYYVYQTTPYDRNQIKIEI